MFIVGLKRMKGFFGEDRKMEITVKMDKDELDLLVWSMEAYCAKAGGQPSYPFAMGVLDGLKAAYKMEAK